MTENNFLVAAFDQAALVLDREQARIDVSTENVDDVQANRCTIRGETRLGLAIVRPGGLIKGGLRVKPATAIVIARLEARQRPSVAEFAALVAEASYAPGKARSAVSRYAAATTSPSGEAAVLASLRSFDLTAARGAGGSGICSASRWRSSSSQAPSRRCGSLGADADYPGDTQLLSPSNTVPTTTA